MIADARVPLKIVHVPARGPVGSFRTLFPLDALGARGHVARCVIPCDASRTVDEAEAERRTDEALTQACSDADIVSVTALTKPWSQERRERIFGRAKVVMDLDDDLWGWEQFRADWRELVKQEAPDFFRTRERQAGFEAWLRSVDAVTTTTEALAQVLREHGAKRVFVTPNGLPKGLRELERVPFAPQVEALTRKLKRNVAWTGSIAHGPDIVAQAPLKAFSRIATVDPTVSISTVGPVSLRGQIPPGTRFMSIQEVPFEAYYPTLLSLHASVAILPCRDTPFNRGKSPITLWGWAALGVPVICSRAGPYGVEEKKGFPAVFLDQEDDQAWHDALTRLLYEPLERVSLARRAREWVLERCLIEHQAPLWEEAYYAIAALPKEALSHGGR